MYNGKFLKNFTSTRSITLRSTVAYYLRTTYYYVIICFFLVRTFGHLVHVLDDERRVDRIEMMCFKQ